MSYVVRLIDGAFLSLSFAELDCAIVIYFDYVVWSFIFVGSIFGVVISSEQHLFSYFVCVGLSPGIFIFIVFVNEKLFSLMYVIPIGFMFNVENHVSAED